MNGSESTLTVSGKKLSQQLDVSLRHVRRLDAAGKIPKPVRIGNSVRWVVSEIDAWLQAGAPDRQSWEAMKGGNNHV